MQRTVIIKNNLKIKLSRLKLKKFLRAARMTLPVNLGEACRSWWVVFRSCYKATIARIKMRVYT